MIPRFTTFAIVLVLVLALPAALPARASVPVPVMRLDAGTSWHYVGDDGSTLDLVMAGPVTTWLGQTAYQRDNLDGHGRADWWMIAPNGDLLLAGLGVVGQTAGTTYDPPVVYLGANPQVGESWTTNTTVIAANGAVLYHLTQTTEVVQEGDVIEPMGVLHVLALNITETATPAPDGAGSSPASTAATTVTYPMLFAPHVGFAEFFYSNGLTSTTMHLASYGLPTPTLSNTWGRLKALYR